MMTLITQAADPEAREAATKMLAQPCVECGVVHAPLALLFDSDHDEGPFVLCADCGTRLGVQIVDAQKHMLAALARDEFADRTIFLLEVARHWNAGRVPLSRKRVFNEERWASA